MFNTGSIPIACVVSFFRWSHLQRCKWCNTIYEIMSWEHWENQQLIHHFSDCDFCFGWIGDYWASRSIHTQRHKNNTIRNKNAIFRRKFWCWFYLWYNLPILSDAIWYYFNHMHWAMPMFVIQNDWTVCWYYQPEHKTNFKGSCWNERKIRHPTSNSAQKSVDPNPGFWYVISIREKNMKIRIIN